MACSGSYMCYILAHSHACNTHTSNWNLGDMTVWKSQSIQSIWENLACIHHKNSQQRLKECLSDWLFPSLHKNFPQLDPQHHKTYCFRLKKKNLSKLNYRNLFILTKTKQLWKVCAICAILFSLFCHPQGFGDNRQTLYLWTKLQALFFQFFLPLFAFYLRSGLANFFKMALNLHL